MSQNFTTVDNCHNWSCVTIVQNFQNCHTCHNCHVTIVMSQFSCHNCRVTIVIYQNLSKFLLLITIVIIISNSSQLYCHNYCLSQLVTIELPQLVIILIIGQNCHNCHNSSKLSQLTQLSQLVTIVTTGLNCHNWSKSSQLVKIVTIGDNF